MTYPFILNGQNLSVYLKGKLYSVNSGHPNFKEIVTGLRNELPEDDLIGIIQFESGLSSVAGAEFRDGMVYFDGEPMPDALVSRYKFMVENDFPVDGFEKFILNLAENPNKGSREELYMFLEACSLPITEDGCFLAYKKVNENYRDCRTGTMDNSVGKTVEMPRGEVNPNRKEACSRGLHVCAKSYLSNTMGSRIVVCKVNPKDVVSVPEDYGNAKMRVCRYEVIDELKESYDSIKDSAVRTGDGVKVSDGGADGRESQGESAGDKKSRREISREDKWNDYIKTRSIPEDLSSLHGNPRKAFIKFCARLHNGDGSEKAGPDICGAKSLEKMRTVIFGF
jgi:hypothetical protein